MGSGLGYEGNPPKPMKNHHRNSQGAGKLSKTSLNMSSIPQESIREVGVAQRVRHRKLYTFGIINDFTYCRLFHLGRWESLRKISCKLSNRLGTSQSLLLSLLRCRSWFLEEQSSQRSLDAASLFLETRVSWRSQTIGTHPIINVHARPDGRIRRILN